MVKNKVLLINQIYLVNIIFLLPLLFGKILVRKKKNKIKKVI